MRRIVKSRLSGATFALAAALALVWASTGVAHADVARGADVRHHTDGSGTRTIVTVEFDETLGTTLPESSAIAVTVDGVAHEYSSLTFDGSNLLITLDGQLTGSIGISYTPPEDAGLSRLQYASGADLVNFDLTVVHGHGPYHAYVRVDRRPEPDRPLTIIFPNSPTLSSVTIKFPGVGSE